MRTHSFFRTPLRFVSCFGLLGVFFLLSGCTTPEASPAPADPPPNETESAPPDQTTDEEPTDEESQELIVSNGGTTKLLSAQAATAPFGKTYLIPEGIEVLSANNALTFSATPDLELPLQATVSTQSLPADYELTLRRDYTSLSLRSEASNPDEVDIDLFPDLHFDHYLTVDDAYGTVHRLVQFDEENEYMYIASLTIPASADLDQEAYEEVVSLFHAILISGNEETLDLEEPSEEAASLTLSEKLLDQSERDDGEDDKKEKEISELSTIYQDVEIAFPVETYELFESLSVQLPEGYKKRSLGEQSYSFTHSDDSDFGPISLIIGLAHPDIPLDLHVSALRSSGTELNSEEFPSLSWYDYAFAEENESGHYDGLTLIKELDDGRILDLTARTNDKTIEPAVLAKIIASLATIESNEASLD